MTSRREEFILQHISFYGHDENFYDFKDDLDPYRLWFITDTGGIIKSKLVYPTDIHYESFVEEGRFNNPIHNASIKSPRFKALLKLIAFPMVTIDDD